MTSENHDEHQGSPTRMEAPNSINNIPSWMPRLGMNFTSSEEAWNFWVFYSGQIGFNIRKKYENTSKMDKAITSCRFVCSNQGYRTKDKRDNLTKVPRAETRTGCKVHMGIMLDRESGSYMLHDLTTEHNHMLQLPETSHLMPSQRKISETQAIDIEMADDSGIRPKAAHELASRYVGGTSNLSYTCHDHKNYLRTKRQRELKYGEAASILSYFQNKIESSTDISKEDIGKLMTQSQPLVQTGPENNNQVLPESDFTTPLVQTGLEMNNQVFQENKFGCYIQLLMGYSNGNMLYSEQGSCANKDN